MEEEETGRGEVGGWVRLQMMVFRDEKSGDEERQRETIAAVENPRKTRRKVRCQLIPVPPFSTGRL